MSYRAGETVEERRARWRLEKKQSDERLGREHTAARWRGWYADNIDYRREYEKAGYANGPRYAKGAVANALNTGALVKSDKCSNCNHTTSVEAHHTDYNKPLEVTWLCNDCHNTVHVEKRLA